MFRLLRRRDFGAVLLVFVLTTPGSYADTSYDEAQTTQRDIKGDRLGRMELRLGQLEEALRAAGHLSPETGQENLALEPLDRLEQRLTALEKLLGDLAPKLATTSTVGTLSTVGVREPQPVSPTTVPNNSSIGSPHQETKSRRVEDKLRFLPSLSYAGGVLHYGTTEERIQLHAFVDIEYTDAGPDGSRSGVSTFDNHHANLFVRSHLGPNLLGHIEIEYEHSGDTVEIDQAYLEWGALDWLSLRAGRFYTPFGIERLVWYSPTNALVSRPEAMRQIVPGNFYAAGLLALGVLEPFAGDRLTYEIAITDGLGDDALDNRRGSRQTRDNNSSRALSGRLGYAFGRQTEIGASYHHQRYSTDSDLDLTFLGLDFSTRWNGWELRSEWVRAILDEPTSADRPIIDDNELEQEGWYAQLAYSFHWNRELLPELRLISRYDVVDFDRDIQGNDDRRLWSVGFNLLLLDHLRTKFEYQFISEDGPSQDDDAFLFQMVLDF